MVREVHDRANRSHDFLTWIQDPENRDEVLGLYYTAREFGQQPSYYAFRDKISLMSQYENRLLRDVYWQRT